MGQDRPLTRSLTLSSLQTLVQEVHCHLPKPNAQECLAALGSVGPLLLLLGIAPRIGAGLSALGSFGHSCQMFATSLAKWLKFLQILEPAITLLVAGAWVLLGPQLGEVVSSPIGYDVMPELVRHVIRESEMGLDLSPAVDVASPRIA